MSNGYLYQLLNLKMRGRLPQYLERSQTLKKSVRDMATELSSKYEMTVSKTAVHNWVRELEKLGEKNGKI